MQMSDILKEVHDFLEDMHIVNAYETVRRSQELHEKVKAARAQQGEGLESAAVHQWREIGETDWMDCHEDWRRKCDDSPLHDTRTLYTHPLKAQGVPEGWQQIVDCAQSLKRQHSLSDRDTVSVGLWKQDPDKPIFHAQFEFSLKDFVLSTTPPADKPEEEWVKCHMETAAIALEALEFYAEERFKGFGNDPEPYEHHLAQEAMAELRALIPAAPDIGGEK
jgi:hypothetical protein